MTEAERIAGQNKIFRKHAVARVELSIYHAHEWAEYFKSINDEPNAKQWTETLKWRLKHLTSLTQNDFQDREYSIQND